MIVILPEWCLDHHQHEPELEKTKQVPTLGLSLNSKFKEKKSSVDWTKWLKMVFRHRESNPGLLS